MYTLPVSERNLQYCIYTKDLIQVKYLGLCGDVLSDEELLAFQSGSTCSVHG
jgi:hypothetical protein